MNYRKYILADKILRDSTIQKSQPMAHPDVTKKHEEKVEKILAFAGVAYFTICAYFVIKYIY